MGITEKMLSKFLILFAVTIISVHSFSSHVVKTAAVKSKATSSELNAFFFPKPDEKSPTLSIKNDKKSKFTNPFAKKSVAQQEQVSVDERKKSSLLGFKTTKTLAKKPLPVVKKASAKSTIVSSKSKKKATSTVNASRVFTGVTGKSFAAKSSSKKSNSFRPSKKTASLSNGSKEKKLV